MPRDPSTKLFSYSAGVPVLENALLDSGDYNAALGDIATDFNAILPIEMGGTGANSVETALSGIGAVSSFYLSELFAGAMGYFAMATPPDGWLVADGRTVSRAAYRTLFLRIGTKFGSGDGSTTFNLPDLRGYFIRGADQGKGVDAGRAVGSNQADENKEHTHTGSAASGGTHSHATERYALVTGPSPPVTLVIADSGGSGANQVLSSSTTSAAGVHNHTITINSAGSEFRPKNIALLGCIKA